MDLIDEEDIAFIEIGQYCCEVAGFFDHWAGCTAQLRAKLACNDSCQRRLTQAGRTVEQHMIEGVSPGLGSLDEDVEVLFDL